MLFIAVILTAILGGAALFVWQVPIAFGLMTAGIFNIPLNSSVRIGSLHFQNIWLWIIGTFELIVLAILVNLFNYFIEKVEESDLSVPEIKLWECPYKK